jgi:hypothetical protein
LRELNEATLNEDAHFFSVQPRGGRREGAQGNYRLYGDRHAVTQNEPNGVVFEYYLKTQPEAGVTLTVTDQGGATVRTLDGTKKAGLNRVVWNPRPAGRRGGGPAQEVKAGEYTVTLKVGDRTYTQKARVLSDVSASAGENPDDSGN